MNNPAEKSPRLELPKTIITAKLPLRLTLIKGNEGIGVTYATKLTYRQCADFFDIESESLSAKDKLQREADKKRVEGIYSYLTSRTNTVFPSACLIVTEMEVKTLIASPMEVVEGTIPANADRLFIDGQGRLGGIKLAIKQSEFLANRHLDIKVIVVPTTTIRESREFVCQIFSDYHLELKKPNPSQNIYFDNELSSSRLAKEILDITYKLGIPFDTAIAVNGKIDHGQLFTLANLTDFITIMVGEKNKKSLNVRLNDPEQYELYLGLISQYMVSVYNILSWGGIQQAKSKPEWKNLLDSNVLTCAIGFKSLAYVGRSLIDEALANESAELKVDALNNINELPLNDKGNKVWVEKEIYQTIDGKLKIVRSSEKRLARILCYRMRVLPCSELS